MTINLRNNKIINLLNSSLLYFATTIIFACTSHIETNNLDSELLSKDSLIRVTNWSMIGPFSADTTVPTLERQNQDLLIPYGWCEKNIGSLNYFLSMCNDITTKDASKIYGRIQMPHHAIDFNKYIKTLPPATIYLSTEINCKDTCSVVFTMSAYQSCKFWLNGELCYEVEWKRGRAKYREEFIPLKLQKGENFILAKVSVNDMLYESIQLKFELDISNPSYAEYVFNQSYFRHFIRRSMLNNGEVLKLYTGPYSNRELKVSIHNQQTGIIEYEELCSPNNLSGLIEINLPYDFSDGFYLCQIETENQKLNQQFFYGDIDNKYQSLVSRYNRLKGLTNKQKNEIEGLIKRCCIKKRRNLMDFDDQVEYWNLIRIPTFFNLEYVISKLEEKKTPDDVFFFRGYDSNYLNKPFYYSAHVPKQIKSTANAPVFFLLETDNKPIDDWKEHWRNYVSNGLDEIIDLADKLGFVAIWTNCGGQGEDLNREKYLFEEILNDAIQTLPLDSNSVFLISNCHSTHLALDLFQAFPDKINGIGFVNPLNCQVPNLPENKKPHLIMLYAFNDEEIPNAESLHFFQKIKKINPEALLITSHIATHYSNPADYLEPVFKYLINTSRSH